MKIVGVESSRDRGRFVVLFEDGEKIRAGTSQIADFGLYSGREMSEDEYAELRENIELNSSKARALRMLGGRNYSAGEVEKRLVGKGDSAETAQKTVEWLESIGAVNDPEYAAMIVRHYYSKGYGLARIKDELFRRGIAREMWDDALAAIDGMEDMALGYLEKKLRGSSDKADLRRAADALCRRGFSYSDASDAIKRYLEKLDSDYSDDSD
ncbi:MAG: recombination regulator RecX [Oscillospiraceae bacterium]|jgi:regulatory protein|nr:recombination regulator RecX [Oscillospiraceae bacterium]